MAANRSVALTVDRPHAPCHVEGDPERLQQVVWNLLSNAIKFTEAGGAATVALTVEGGDAVIRVSDTGIGMPASFVPHAFERFRQADGTLTREHGGLGLGLAIVRELTELHGGRVSAASDGPGRGSTFTVRLPHAPALRPVPAAAGAEPPLPSLAGLHVLAVDDNDDALDVLVDVLAGAGARVTVARSGAQAVAGWRSMPADVLVCDLAMPGMDGFAVLERIREMDAAAGRLTPALAVTAHGADELRARSLRAGFLAHLVKPYSRAELVIAVAAIGEKV
jgi:CheY-like chemotaxis protein